MLMFLAAIWSTLCFSSSYSEKLWPRGWKCKHLNTSVIVFHYTDLPASQLIMIIFIFRWEVFGKHWHKTICLQVWQNNLISHSTVLKTPGENSSPKYETWRQFSQQNNAHPSLVTNFSVNLPVVSLWRLNWTNLFVWSSYQRLFPLYLPFCYFSRSKHLKHAVKQGCIPRSAY